jgi:hypothetical protein
MNKSERQPRLCLFAPGYGGPTAGTERFQKLGSSKEKAVFERNKNSRTERAAERVPEEARQEWLAMLQGLAEQIQKQQQNSQQMVQELMDTYMQLLNTPGSYLSGQAQEQQQTLRQTAQQWMEQAQQQQQAFQQQAQQQQQAFRQMTQEVLSTYSQLFNIPVSYAQEGLRSTQFPVEGYDELSVEEVSGRLGDLSAEELRVVRDYEERNKNRDTLLEQLDRKIRGSSYPS